MAALAALAADESPRAAMMAAPRFCTVGMKLVSSQAWSLIMGQTFLPSASAWNRSGYWVAEWLPQTVILRRLVTGLPSLAPICDSERLWSRRIMPVNCRGDRLGAFFIAISALVFAGLPTIRTFTLRLATAFNALPCGTKIAPLASRRSLRSLPAVRGRAQIGRASWRER